MTEFTSERERELYEAVRGLWNDIGNLKAQIRVGEALHAYDPKPEPVYILPEWEDFIRNKTVGHKCINFKLFRWVVLDGAIVSVSDYNAIRTATAKTPE
jgi:hypothetical protein